MKSVYGSLVLSVELLQAIIAQADIPLESVHMPKLSNEAKKFA